MDCLNVTAPANLVGSLSVSARREQRKRELMAKILARTSGAHEVLGGPGVGTTAFPSSRDRFDGNTAEGPKTTGGSGVPGGSTREDLRGETEGQGSDVGCDSALEGNETRSSARLRPKALDCAPSKSKTTTLSDGEDYTCCAPREGGELQEEEVGRSAPVKRRPLAVELRCFVQWIEFPAFSLAERE